MHWSCRRQTSTKNTLQQTKHFNVDFHSNGCYFFFINISEKYFQFRKATKALVKENFWFTSYR